MSKVQRARVMTDVGIGLLHDLCKVTEPSAFIIVGILEGLESLPMLTQAFKLRGST
jgi:hypothetical protein